MGVRKNGTPPLEILNIISPSVGASCAPLAKFPNPIGDGNC